METEGEHSERYAFDSYMFKYSGHVVEFQRVFLLKTLSHGQDCLMGLQKLLKSLREIAQGSCKLDYYSKHIDSKAAS